MHMRTGRRSRIPYIAYDISSLYFLSRPHRELAHMSIQGGIPITMIDDDMIPIASAVIFHFRHNAIPFLINFCSDRGSEINSLMHHMGFVDGMNPIAETGSQSGNAALGHRLNGGNGRQ